MDAESAGEPSGVVADANVRARSDERFRDERDLAAAERGFLGTLDPLDIHAADGREVWNAESFRFLAADPADSVHPSLWRQARVITNHGLFAGVAMGRRSGYMYGASLPRGPRGQVTAGLVPRPPSGRSGHWPTWGGEEIREFLEVQRDLYAYLHDHASWRN